MQFHCKCIACKLDNLYLTKAQGAYIRSRAKWIEAGEKNTSYFCGLEKRRQERKTINTLMINNVECTDHKQYLKEFIDSTLNCTHLNILLMIQLHF